MASFNGQGSTASRLQSHNKKTVYFLPLSPQKFLVLIWSTLEGWKTDLTLSCLLVFNPGPLDWENSTITTRPLLLKILNSLNLQQHWANAAAVPLRFFLMMAKFCHHDISDITLVKAIVTPTNVLTLFQALPHRPSCSLVMWFTDFEKIQRKFTRFDSSQNQLQCYKPLVMLLNNWWKSSLLNIHVTKVLCLFI